MNQYLYYIAIGFGILLVMMLIPGIKVVAEWILKTILDLFVEVFKHKGTFMVWLVKTVVGDHGRVFRHASTARDELDPTQKIRRAEAGYED